MSCVSTSAAFFAASAIVATGQWAASAQTLPPNGSAKLAQMQKLLEQTQIETKPLQEKMQLSQYLEALAKQLPGDKKVTLRIDEEAFGKNRAKVANAPVHLKTALKRMSLLDALDAAMSDVRNLNIETDFGIEADRVFITTAERALYLAEYDIGALVEKPESMTFSGSGRDNFKENLYLRNLEPATRAALVVKALYSSFVRSATKVASRETIEVLNGTRLAIRANPVAHAEIANLLEAMHRLGDLYVIVNAQLYEVDQESYDKVAKRKRLSMQDLEELERRFLDGTLPKAKGESLWDLLEKQKPVLASKEVKIDSGAEAAVLSRHTVATCLPGPDQLLKRDQGRQSFLEGVSFLAGVRVSPDRRFVHLKLTEKATELKAINKIKVPHQKDADLEFLDSESPMLDETVQARVEIISDGGSILVPVQYRPRSVQAKNRWWVLSITPRIYIPEEEEQIQIFEEQQKLQGRWKLCAVRSDKELDKQNFEYTLVIQEDRITREHNDGRKSQGRFTLAPDKNPKQIDVTWDDKKLDLQNIGIYAIESDYLTISFSTAAPANKSLRPIDFTLRPGGGRLLLEFERVKK